MTATEHLDPAHLAALAPHARRLAEILGRLSVVAFGEPWHRHLEHLVWQATQEDGADREALGLSAIECAALRELAHKAEGWIIESDGPRFVAAPTWRAFHAVWLAQRAGRL